MPTVKDILANSHLAFMAIPDTPGGSAPLGCAVQQHYPELSNWGQELAAEAYLFYFGCATFPSCRDESFLSFLRGLCERRRNHCGTQDEYEKILTQSSVERPANSALRASISILSHREYIQYLDWRLARAGNVIQERERLTRKRSHALAEQEAAVREGIDLGPVTLGEQYIAEFRSAAR